MEANSSFYFLFWFSFYFKRKYLIAFQNFQIWYFFVSWNLKIEFLRILLFSFWTSLFDQEFDIKLKQIQYF